MYAVVNPEPLERDQIEPGLAVPAHRDLHEQPGLVGQLGQRAANARSRRPATVERNRQARLDAAAPGAMVKPIWTCISKTPTFRPR